MNVQEEIKKHEDAIGLLEKIKMQYRHLNNVDESINGIAGLIKSQRDILEMQRDKIMASIAKLKKKYTELRARQYADNSTETLIDDTLC